MGKNQKQLSKAIAQNNYDLVWQLLQKDFDKSLLNRVDKYNNTYLIDAISFCSSNIVDLLLKMVLTLEYDRCLNNLMWLEEEYLEQKYKAICYIKGLIRNWIEARDVDLNKLWNGSILQESPWILIRKLSLLLKYYLQIENNVNKASLKKIIIDSLHP